MLQAQSCMLKMNAQVQAIEERVTTVVVEPKTVEEEIPVTPTPRVEEFKISRESLLGYAKKLIHQGEIRYFLIRDKQGQTRVELPLLIAGVGLTLGAVWFPLIAAVGALAVVGANLTLVVERKEQ